MPNNSLKRSYLTIRRMADPIPESIFQQKYNEFVEDLLGALPEYTAQINLSKSLNAELRLTRFQKEVKCTVNMFSQSEEYATNPGTILPDVEINDDVWATLSEQTQKRFGNIFVFYQFVAIWNPNRVILNPLGWIILWMKLKIN